MESLSFLSILTFYWLSHLRIYSSLPFTDWVTLVSNYPYILFVESPSYLSTLSLLFMESLSFLSILTFYWLSHLGIYSSLVSHLLSHLYICLFLVFDLVLSFPFLFVSKFVPIFLFISHCIFIFSQSLSISLCLFLTSVRMLEPVCTCLPAQGCVCACTSVTGSGKWGL